ncbi:hypothetical protein Goari_014231 [Gossypium aridum]|uniref:Uncharacterized protein n=1 Tax=Gossypium aridum TaxID=34290 RepID=A0A7J8XHS2_GOSAI|nr:hypothetical protein [Gossypium aridum]
MEPPQHGGKGRDGNAAAGDLRRVVVVETGCWHLWELRFGYCCRETIKAADFIPAKLYFFTDPPQAIRGIL